MKIGKNQYLIVPRKSMGDKFQYDKMLKFGHYFVLLGDGCHTAVVRSSRMEILLVGYAIDAQNPQNKEEDMLNQLAIGLERNTENLSDLTLYWGGRWVLFIMHNENMIAMTDCCGLKQLLYASNVFGSQSRYVAYAVNNKEDADAKCYIQHAMAVDKEYSWPLYATPYRGIKRLLPNHLYDKGRVVRIHPSESFFYGSVSERTKAVLALLKNMVNAAGQRTNLAVTLTAGWDSRLVLAACDEMKDKIDVVTLKYHHIPDDHIDIQISKQLCEKYGYVHKILPCKALDAEFVEAYKKHSENAHEYWMQMAQCVRDYGYDDWLWTKGSCNEVGRNSSGILYNWQVSARILSKLYGILSCDYSKTIIREWMKGAQNYAAETKYSVLDLFYWEHRLGSWLAECLNEADVVGETFTPFNVRAYFELIKGVTISERISPNYKFFEDVLKVSGMDLSIPVNPHRYDSIASKIKCLMKNKLHILYGVILSR